MKRLVTSIHGVNIKNDIDDMKNLESNNNTKYRKMKKKTKLFKIMKRK